MTDIDTSVSSRGKRFADNSPFIAMLRIFNIDEPNSNKNSYKNQREENIAVKELVLDCRIWNLVEPSKTIRDIDLSKCGFTSTPDIRA